MAVIGAGDVGHAVTQYQGFSDRGFRVTMIFDKDPIKIGTQINGFVVQDTANMEKVIQENRLKIAMIAVPAEAAQKVADQLVEAGVCAILNYAPISLNVPVDVRVAVYRSGHTSTKDDLLYRLVECISRVESQNPPLGGFLSPVYSYPI